MNSSIARIIWKEYRQQRPLLLSVFCLSIVSQLALVVFAVSANEALPIDGIFVIGLGMPALYALGCGALLFAGEDEAGTIALLRSLPISRRELLIGKLGFAVVSTLLLVPVLWLATVGITQGTLPSPPTHANIWLVGGVGWIEMLALSMLCSLIARRVLWATLVAGCIAAVDAICWMAIVDQEFVEADTANFRLLPFHVAITIAVLLVVVFVGQRWLGESPTAKSIPRRKGLAWGKMLELRDRWQMGLSRFTSASACAKLLWQEYRQSTVSRWVVFAAFAPGLFLAVAGRTESGAGGWHPLFMILPALGALIGAVVFAGDQRQFGYRFFGEHGVQPRLVWLARQMIWIGWLTIAILAVCAIAALHTHSTARWLVGAVGLAILFYAIGQTCSLFVRSALLAIVTTVGGCVIAGTWCFLIDNLGISVWWAVGPLVPVLLFATWLRMPHWISERTTWRARLRAAASVGLPVLALLVSISIYRAIEIPRIPLPYDRHELERTPTTEESETAEKYVEAYVQFQAAAAADAATSDQLRADAMALFTAATQKQVCRFTHHHGIAIDSQVDVEGLLANVVGTAELLETEQRFDDALQLYFALLRMAEHLYAQPSGTRTLQGLNVEQVVLERLPRWAATSGQSSARVRDVLKQLEAQLQRGQADWRLACSGDFCLFRRVVELDPATVERFFGEEMLKLRYVAWIGGWEQIRMLRLLDAMAARELEFVRMQTRRLSDGRAISTQVDTQRRNLQDERIEAWRKTTPMARNLTPGGLRGLDLAEYENRRRVARIQLALVAWQIEHRALPASLDELVGHGLKHLPIDAFSGQPFYYAREGGFVLNDLEKVFEPGPPVLWSPGRLLRLSAATSSQLPHHKRYNLGNRPLRDEFGIWQYGVSSPIPIVTAEP